MGKIKLPEGKKVAVNLGVDFDAQSLWLGAFNWPSPSFMARGEFGAEVGVPRLLELFRRYDVTSTFFTPGHTIDTFTDACKAIQADGHEFGVHGYYHENPTKIERDTEKRLMELAFSAYDKQLGIKPVGYRSPYWDYSESTLDLIEEFGFIYDSSLMARDLVPYHPQRWQINWESANIAGPASRVLEIPVNWYLDDFPALAYTGAQAGMQDSNTIFQRWKDIFDYAYDRVDNACYAVAVHPQVIGQAHHMMWFERLVDYIAGKDGTWFCTCEDIARAWESDEEDERKFALPDVRGVEQAPVGSGFR